MRWFWQRRKRQAVAQAASPTEAPSTPVASSSQSVQRAASTSGRLGQPREMTSEHLLLARDYLLAIGGKVRVEDEDVISATLPDGSLIRYTTTQAKAHADESMTLLVEGSEALGAMLDDIAARSRVTALRLSPMADPVALALQKCGAPAESCGGRCLQAATTLDGARMTLCETCPLRDNRLALRWRAAGPLTARLVSQEDSLSIEIAYLIVARDRQGRHDEWIRRAYDSVTERPVAILTDSTLAAAAGDEPPVDYAMRLAVARSVAEHALGEPLAATGVFLRQRSLHEYQTRQEEVTTTFDRLQRESPEAARAAKSSRKRELAALAEVYAVDIEGSLESACFITAPHALVAIRPRKGHGELLVRVDMGRQQVIPPDCAQCGASVEAGYVCDAGHALCPRCAAACARCGAWTCATCSEARPAAACAQCGEPIEQPAAIEVDAAARSGATLNVAHLEALPPAMWNAAMEWLLSCQKITVESRRAARDVAVWRGRSDAGQVEIVVLRLQPRLALDEFTLCQAAARLTLDAPALRRMLITTAPARQDVHLLAQHLGIELVDRPALETLLAGLGSAFERERMRQQEEMQTRADAADAARQALLGVIDAVERALTSRRRSRRNSGSRTASVADNRALERARGALERAALAWETLLADWYGAFGERADRSGRLAIQVESERFCEMSDRSAHLQAALLDAVAILEAAPTRGDSGYTAWRQAILDECSARCEAWRWRIRSYDPAAWSDFAHAWNAKAAAKAAEAAIAAGHATARADKAQAQALRAG